MGLSECELSPEYFCPWKIIESSDLNVMLVTSLAVSVTTICYARDCFATFLNPLPTETMPVKMSSAVKGRLNEFMK